MKNLSILLLVTLLLTSCGKVVNNDEKITSQDNTEVELNIENNNTSELTEDNSESMIQDKDSLEVIDKNISTNNEEIVAVMETNYGDITLELYLSKVPKTVTNFIVHAQNNYYDGVTFHRIINGFMIQGGDPLGTGMGWESIYGKSFDDEFDPTLSNVPGTISMANSGPNTNWSQFFINQWNNTNLDYNKQPLSSKHAVFGTVIKWMDVVEKIALVPGNQVTGNPSETVTIEDIKLYTSVNWKLKAYTIPDIEQAKQDAIQKNKEITEKKQESLKDKSAQSGDTVGVKYRLTLNDGTQVDGNFESDTAFDFTIDQQWIITGFSEAVKWMKIWDKKTVKLAPKDAYWEYDENNTQNVPKELLQTFIDAGIKLEKWNTLPTERGNFIIKDVTETEVIIDVNHSLAGKELNFELELKYFVN